MRQCYNVTHEHRFHTRISDRSPGSRSVIPDSSPHSLAVHPGSRFQTGTSPPAPGRPRTAGHSTEWSPFPGQFCGVAKPCLLIMLPSGGQGPDGPRPVFCRRARNAVARCCTTRSQNAHGTEEREVLYPWHPWAGRAVHVHDVIEKAGWAAFRCSLNGVASDRRLEAPVWMFDRAACQC